MLILTRRGTSNARIDAKNAWQEHGRVAQAGCKPGPLRGVPRGPELFARIVSRQGPRAAEGPWAGIAWNPDTQTLIGIRDPLGEVPLYFAQTETRAGIATDPLELLAAIGTSPRPNRRRIASFCLGETDDHTDDFLLDLERVRPGELVEIGPRSVRRRVWWDAPDPRDTRSDSRGSRGSRKERAEPSDLDRWLIQALEPLRGDVTLALSGGVDSALVATYLATRTDLDVRAIHLASDRFPSADETDLARELARTLGFEFERILIEEIAPETLSTANQPLPFPVASLDAALRRAAHGTTLVTGLGGDQLFSAGAALSIRSMVADAELAALARQVDLRSRRDWIAVARGLVDRSPTAAAVAQLLPTRDAGSAADRVAEREPWMKPSAWIDAEPRSTAPAPLHRTWAWEDVVRNASAADELHDVATLHPFLDPRLWRWAASLPNHVRFRDRTDKWLLRQHLRARLPGSLAERLANRPKLQTFNAWAASVLAEPNESILRASLLTQMIASGSVRPSAFHNRFTAFGRVVRSQRVPLATLHSIALWRTLAAEQWISRLKRDP